MGEQQYQQNMNYQQNGNYQQAGYGQAAYQQQIMVGSSTVRAVYVLHVERN